MTKLFPYIQLLRFDKPIGIGLLLLPCWWGIALASNGLPSLFLLMLFTIGAVVMRSAGCIINDIWDRKLDAQVERTKNRPLATGVIPLWHAFSILALLLSIGFIIALQLPFQTMVLAAAALPLVALYPFMKRITYYPQVFLGFTFNWGVLVGWHAVQPQWHVAIFFLYLAGILWTVAYDTLYALQDIHDDKKAGIKSTAILAEKQAKPVLLLLYAATSFSLTACLYFSGYTMALLLAALCSFAFYFFPLRLHTLSTNKPFAYGSAFRQNIWLGFLIFFIIVTGKLL